MAVKYQNDSMLDDSLGWIRDNCTRICMCNAALASDLDYAHANNDPSTSSGCMLAQKNVTASSWAIAAGDTSGRKLTVPQVTSIPCTTSGTVRHIALVDASSTLLAYATSTAAMAVVASNNYTMQTWNIELRDAS